MLWLRPIRLLSCAISSALLLCLAVPSVFADTVSTKKRTVTQLADGVYEIRHPDAPDQFSQSNTTVIIGSDTVLVVDSCYLPSSAREDIVQIRKWTPKPVRYLLNTHWHYDHTLGNSEYADAFPGLLVIAHTETRNQIAGYTAQYFQKYPDRVQTFQKILDDGKNADGSRLTEADIASYKKAIAGVAPVLAEFQKISGRLSDLTPTVTFDHQMNIQLGGREVQLEFLGRGNTAGDAVAYLPAEKILIAGDLLDHPIPFFFSGFPYEQIETLGRLALLDANTIVPGHGDILRDKSYLQQEQNFLRLVTGEVDKAISKFGPGQQNYEAVHDEVMKQLDVPALRKQFAIDDSQNNDFFDDTLAGLIRAAFNSSSGK